MFVLTMKLDKKKAVFIIIIAALILIGIILLAGINTQARSTVRDTTMTVKNEKSGAEFLTQLGWEVETPAISKEKVIIPRTFSTVFDEYNNLQKEQGFDLSKYCGTEVDLYTYSVKNIGDSSETVVAQIYVSNGVVIGGDIHSTALDGFMRGIK